tara:strand:+ start:1103 stop:1324 length:222 start_codon:yes stop_codon:yes gene_type:complete
MTYTTEQIERHLAIRAANVGEDGADVQIVRQLLAERDAARGLVHRATYNVPEFYALWHTHARAALSTQEKAHD